ncbi:hypothetical protein [Nodosilinea sp. LEGE 07298]|uniref:hypothetical protein n=1 Tax=Nodosilinea sp. LEGE 07298 TaxID=2777970 RepID=UPI0037C987F4
MFEYLEPDASGASNIPPSQSARPQPRPERVRHMLYGSLAGIVREASPSRRIALSKSSMPTVTPTPTTRATPSPHRPALRHGRRAKSRRGH